MKGKSLIVAVTICSSLLTTELSGGGRTNRPEAQVAFSSAVTSENTGSAASQAQTDNVTGTVTDENGQPLVGVMVYIKGTTTGVSTDLDGNYSIKAPEEGESYTLVYQYIGTITQEILVSRQRKINVSLKNDNELEEAMIVGAYGKIQRREDMVGSAYQVNSDALKDKPKSRIDNILQGLVPGLSIDNMYDSAQSTRDRYNARIRGESSLSGSSEPLWIIDGVPAYTGSETGQIPGMSYTVSPLSFLDPNDIASITVLKDADQTTQYGANGAGGVILVTTKQGASSKGLSVNASVQYSLSAPDKSTMVKTMNAQQYLEVAREAWVNSGNSISSFPYQDNDYNTYSTTATDWSDVYLGLSSSVYASVSLSSSSDKVDSYVSGSYLRSENIVQSDYQERFYLRMNEKFKLTKNLNLQMSLMGSYNTDNIFALGKEFIGTLPIFSPYLNDGYSYRLSNKVYNSATGDWQYQKFYDNSVPDREENTNRQRAINTVANFNLSWQIIQGLQLEAIFGINYTHRHEDRYSARTTLDGMDLDGNPLGYSQRRDASYQHWTNIERLSYDRRFGKHKIGANISLELNSDHVKTLGATGNGFMNDNIQEISYADEESIDANSSRDISRSMSYFGRLEYSFDSRYIIAGNFRRDGSSVFGIYNQWATFWSVGASWNIHKEPFFNSDFIRMLKLRASYGSAGNSRIDGSIAKGTYNYSNSYSYGGIAGATLGSAPNPGLSWETTWKTDIGARVELGDFLEIDLDFYHHKTVDLLNKVYVSRTITDERVQANIGKMQNIGIELNLQSTNIRTPDFKWTTTLNMAHNENKILELYEGVPTGFFTSVWMEGYDSNSFWLVEWAGVDPADGTPLWYDDKGNITRTFSYDYRKPGKSPTPIVYGGLINTMSYKNWSLSFQINYTVGGYALPSYTTYMSDGYDIISANQAVEVYYYRWTTPGQAALYPKVMQTSNNQSTMSSTRYLYRRTNFNLSNLTLTYNLPKHIVQKLNLKSASLSLIGDNVYLFTPGQSKKFNSYKTLMNGYPVTRTFTLNLTVGF